MYDVGQYTSVVSAGVSQYCGGGGVRSTPLVCTAVSSSFDTTHVVWSDSYRNATGSSMSGELPVCRTASHLGRVSPISTLCSTLLGSECGSMLSESAAQPRVTQCTAINGISSRTLVSAGSNSGELTCVDAKHRDSRDSSASDSYCSLLMDGATGYPYVGPAPFVEDWMYEHRPSCEVQGSPYICGDGAASPWFDRSPGRPPYTVVIDLSTVCIGLQTVSIGQLSYSVGPWSVILTVHTCQRTVHLPSVSRSLRQSSAGHNRAAMV